MFTNFGRQKSISFSGEVNQNNTFKQNSSPFGQTSIFGNTSSPFSTNTFGQAISSNPCTFNNSMFGNNSFDSSNKSFGSPNNSIFSETSSSQMDINSDHGDFGSTSIFSSAQDQLGTPIKFNPIKGNESIFKGSLSQNLITTFQSITCMKEYETKSFEELRLEDYQLNRKGVQQGFLMNTPQTPNVPFFKSTTSIVTPTFGQESVFGQKTVGTGFGQITSPFALSAPKNNSSSLFNNTTGFRSTANPSFSPFVSNVQNNDLFKNKTVNSTVGFSAQPNNSFGQSQGFGLKSCFGSNQTTKINLPADNKKNSFNLGASPSNNPFIQSNFGSSSNTASLNNPLFGQSNQINQPKTFTLPTNVGTSLFNQQQKPNSLGGGGFPINIGTSLYANKPNSINLFDSSKPIANTQFNFSQPTPLLSLSNQNQSGFNSQQQLQALLSTPYGTSSVLSNILSETEVKQYTNMTNPEELNTILKNVLNPQPVEKKKKIKIAQLKVLETNNSIFTGLEFPDEELISNIRVNKHPKRLIIRNKLNDVSNNLIANCNSFESKNINQDKSYADISSIENLENNISNDSEIYYESETFVNTSVIPSKSNEVTLFSTTKTDVMYGNCLNHKNNLNDMTDIDKEINIICNSPEKQIETIEVNLAPVESNEPSISTIYLSHPTGIILTRPGYYTMPSLDELTDFINKDGSCFVQGFTIGRHGYGNVYFPDTFDVCNLNLDELVHFTYKEITIYPDDSKKPPIGQGLNRRAHVTLDGVFPRDKKTRELITDIETLMTTNFSSKLIKLCQKQGISFLDYRPETGSWVFKVKHF